MPRKLSVVIIVAMSCLLAAGHARADETIGVIRNSAGHATIGRAGRVIPAAVGTKLLVGDTLATGPGATMGVILRDNSTLSLGPASSLVIRKFLFAPAEGKLGLLVRVTRGTMAYLSGLIGRLAPESARFETPVATIGTRGTRFAVRLDG
ncbi:MAG TPA: FecR domain-containing protein [Candidatus Deferrimicrobiaceae bacterium]